MIFTKVLNFYFKMIRVPKNPLAKQGKYLHPSAPAKVSLLIYEVLPIILWNS